jgi:2-methylcitrate dehydratase PrpD
VPFVLFVVTPDFLSTLDNPEKEISLEQARLLAEFLSDTSFSALPHAALQAGKRGILDCLGTAIGGARSIAANLAIDVIGESTGKSAVTLIARSRKASLLDAALYNATAAHALDFDDTLSPPTAIGALALAEQRGFAGRELLRSFILGFEVASRITKAIGGWENARGWHMMGVAGVFGAATAAALLTKLNPQQIVHALGIAATQASGLVAMHGFLIKPFHSGKAAANGIFAAELAARGCTTGPALEGSLSVTQAMGGTPTPDLAQNLGNPYAILSNRLKPFPCGRLGHAAIEAALKVRRSHDLKPDEIVAVEVRVEPHAQYLMGKTDPQNGTQSMFSIAHGVTAGLLYGKVGPDQFSDSAANDAQVKDLRRRVDVLPEPKYVSGQATIMVRTKNRGALTEEVPIQKGFAKNPLTDDDVKEKFLGLAEPIIGSKRAAEAVELVYRIETVNDAGDLARHCA